jgi:hypothetical protein
MSEHNQYDKTDEFVVAVLWRAVADAQQSENPAMAEEAWEFLTPVSHQ